MHSPEFLYSEYFTASFGRLPGDKDPSILVFEENDINHFSRQESSVLTIVKSLRFSFEVSFTPALKERERFVQKNKKKLFAKKFKK